MKRTQKDWQIDMQTNFKDGEGTIEIQKFITGDEFCGKGRMFAQFILPPNSSIGVHKHEGEQEIYFITQGRAEYIDNNETYDAGVGDVLICKDGESHGVKNIGTDDLKYTALILFTV